MFGISIVEVKGMNTLGDTIARLAKDVETFARTILPEDLHDRFLPDADLVDAGEAYLIRLDVPGLTKRHLTITVLDGTVTVSGERQAQADGAFLKRERRHGAFQRSFTVPGGVAKSDITATVKDGVLTLTIRKHVGKDDTTISID